MIERPRRPQLSSRPPVATFWSVLHGMAVALVFVLPAWAWTLPARAADEIRRPLAIDFTSYSATSRVDAIAAFIATQTPLQPNSYPIVSGASPEFVQTYHWLLPPNPPPSCPVPYQTLEQQLDEANALIVNLELPQALSLLKTAQNTLPCHTRLVPREQLRRMFYLEGIAHQYDGDVEGANAAWMQALSIEPSLIPLGGFGPDINDAFLNAARGLTSLKSIPLTIDEELRTQRIYIDGETLPADASIPLRPGKHLAQATNAEGLARTALFDLYEDGPTRLKPMLEVLPTESASYVRETLRTYLLSGKLTASQQLGLMRFAREKAHPYLLFVTASTSSAGGMELLVFDPEKGLLLSPPPDLVALPTMPIVAPPPQEAPIATPAAAAPREAPAPVVSAKSGYWLELGAANYASRTFLQTTLGYRLPLVKALHARLGLVYANDLARTEEAALHQLGLQLGLEAAFPVGPAQGFAGGGVQANLYGIVNMEDRPRLLLVPMPVIFAGARYPLLPFLDLGLAGLGGFSPGLVGEVGPLSLWQVALSAQLTR